MKKITIEESKNIQLDILRNIDSFCLKNNIRYSISGGTLLGAIRHKGFIPWDDDIDILMPRSDYDRFLASFVDKTSILKLHCLQNDPNYCYSFAKVEDTRTIIDENVSGPKMGIAIDVFPFDNLYDDKEKSISRVKYLMKLKFLYRSKLIIPNSNNSFLKKISIYALHFLTAPLSLRKMAVWYEKKCKECKNNSLYVCCLVWGYGLKEMFTRDLFDEFIRIPFEQYSFSALKQYDRYLSQLYGDYMKLPPKEKQKSPHSLNGIYWRD